MNRELANIFNSIVLISIATVLLSWGYSILDANGIEYVGGFSIRFAFFAITNAMLAGIFILMALHCRNRYRLGDNRFLFPFKGLGVLSLIAIYDTAESILELGDDISYLKVFFEIVLFLYLIKSWAKARKNGRAA